MILRSPLKAQEEVVGIVLLATRGTSERLGGPPGRAKAVAPSQLEEPGPSLAGLRRRRIRNPGSLLNFS